MQKQTQPLKVAFSTLGCRTNQHDTAEMQTLLQREGFAVVGTREKADVYVVNTCTVTARSDYSSRLAVKKSLAINENALVIFTGCYAQMNPAEAANLPGTDVILGNANKLEVASVIKDRLLSGTPRRQENRSADLHFSDIRDADRKFTTLPVSGFHGKTKAFIKVQTGCDEKCAFCTVALARGRSLSDAPENILRNIQQAVASGYREITLTGINLGAYGWDRPGRKTLASLVRDIIGIRGEFRVRISSINPMEIDDDLIGLIAESEKICPHLHIPLQSGDDSILRRMRRNYDSGQYLDKVHRILEKIPHPGLGADVIAGFPGETEAQFEKTRKLIDGLPYSYLHVFSYSPRPKTEAAGFKDDIPGNVKKARNKVLTELGLSKGQRFRRGFLGQTVSVLVENQPDAATGLLKGHSEHFIPVLVQGARGRANQILPVTLEEISGNQVLGCARS